MVFKAPVFPETIEEESRALSYDEVKSKMTEEN